MVIPACFRHAGLDPVRNPATFDINWITGRARNGPVNSMKNCYCEAVRVLWLKMQR